MNRFPDFVRYIVRRLKVLCPTMGKVKIAQVLCRAGSASQLCHGGTDVEGTVTTESDNRRRVQATRVVTAETP